MASETSKPGSEVYREIDQESITETGIAISMPLGPFSVLPDATGGAIIGVIIAGTIRYLLQLNEDIKSRMNLRRALIAELNAARPVLENIHPEETDITEVLSNIPRVIFDGNVNRIGELTSDEVTALSQFYSTMTSRQLETHRVRRLSPRRVAELMISDHEDRLSTRLPDIDLEKGSPYREEITTIFSQMLEEDLPDDIDQKHLRELRERRSTAIDQLESNLMSRRELIKYRTETILPTITDIRTPDNWREIPSGQRVVLVIIGHLFRQNPFTYKELKESSKNEDFSNILVEDLDITCLFCILQVLVAKNMLKRVGEKKYQITDTAATSILVEGQRFPEINENAYANPQWIP